MRDQDKTREQLVEELARLRQRLAASEGTAYTHSAPGTGPGEAGPGNEMHQRFRRLEAIVNATSDGTFEWDMTTNWLYWDERFHALMGTSPESFTHGIGEFISRIHRDDITSANAALYAHLERNEPYRVEVRLRREDGEYLRVSVAGEALRDADGSPVALIGAVTDMSREEGTPGASVQAGLQYHTLFEHLREAVFTVEPGGGFIEVNPRLCEILQYESSELLQSNALDMLLPSHVARWLGIIGQASAEGNALGEVRLRRRDGAVLVVEMSCARLPDGNFLCSLRDAPEAPRSDVMYSQSEIMEGMERFSRGLAHELNNMLTPIIGYAQLSERALTGHENVRNYLNEIQNSADRAASLTRQLLAFARRQVMQPEIVNINDLINEMQVMLRPLIGDEIELEILPAGGLWPVRVDPRQIEQALVNLAVNARDAMPEGGKLTIETANTFLDEEYAERHAGVVPGEYISISVTDTGIGMSPEVRAHALEPFFTTKRPGQGAGLGLSACYGIVAQNDGHIEIFSEPGLGATIRLYFPRTEALG